MLKSMCVHFTADTPERVDLDFIDFFIILPFLILLHGIIYGGQPQCITCTKGNCGNVFSSEGDSHSSLH